jgi:DNA-binding response OmpR family regulator
MVVAVAPGKSVLIIDDHSAVADMLERAFRRAGYRVSLARRGAAGITKAFAERHAAVVLDLRLPDISGLEVARALRPIVPPVVLFVLKRLSRCTNGRGVDETWCNGRPAKAGSTRIARWRR